MIEIILALLLALIAGLTGWYGSRRALLPRERAAVRGRKSTMTVLISRYGNWLAGGSIFICEVLGVLFSLYVTRQAFNPPLNVVVLSLGIAAISYAFTYASKEEKTSITLMDLFTAFKDGFLWQASLPAVANMLGITGIKMT